MFGKVSLQTDSPKVSEESEELVFLFHLCSKKQILPSGASLVKLFSKNVFGRTSPKKRRSRS
jgi:hypothetical protein